MNTQDKVDKADQILYVLLKLDPNDPTQAALIQIARSLELPVKDQSNPAQWDEVGYWRG